MTLLADSSNSFAVSMISSVMGPIGVIVGAVIAGVVSRRNARVSVYERLETLLKLQAEWPEVVTGRETVERSIAIALAEIRRKEPGHPPERTTEQERIADRDVRVAARSRGGLLLLAALAALISIGLIVATVVRLQHDTGMPQGVIYMAVVVLIYVAVSGDRK